MTTEQRIDEILKPLRDFGEYNAHTVTYEYGINIAADLKEDTAEVNRFATEAKQALLKLIAEERIDEVEEYTDNLCRLPVELLRASDDTTEIYNHNISYSNERIAELKALIGDK